MTKKTLLLTCASALASLTLLTACSQEASSKAQNQQSSSMVATATATRNDKGEMTNITLSGSTASISGTGASQDDSIITISKAGTYAISGQGENVQVRISAAKTDHVQVILDGVTLSGQNTAIYAEQAQTVTLTLADGSVNTLSDNQQNEEDAVILAKTNLIINGSGQLNVEALSDKAIKANDTLQITGGNYQLTAVGDTFNVNDQLHIENSQMTLTAGEDAIKVDNDDDLSLGNLYLANNDITISAGDDAIHASGKLVVDSGNYNILTSTEGLEGTSVTINGGTLLINATDDGINAANTLANPNDIAVTITGGDITINMAQGDTDAIDSNGNLTVSGGNITINAQFAFDFDGVSSYTGGVITVNGQKVTDITNSMMIGGPTLGQPRGF